MGYRNLASERFRLVKDATKKVCEQNGLVTIGDFKRVGNLIIDEIQAERMSFSDLLQPVIDYKPPSEEKEESQ